MTEPTLVGLLHRFADELRARGLPVSMSERVDAMKAVAGASLDNTHGLRTALGATLVKSADHLAVFDEVFQLYFRSAVRSTTAPTETEVTGEDPSEVNPTAGSPPGDGGDPGVVPIDLDRALRAVLREGSEALARLVAEQAVQQFASFTPGRRVAGLQYESLAVSGLRLDQVSAEVRRELATDHLRGMGPDRYEVAERADAMRQRIREVIREMLVADRGVDAVAATLRTPLPTDVVISMAGPGQLAEIERVMQPLQRKLATTMMRKRRRRSGALDLRATVRGSMATGGVPFRVIQRRPIPTKPKLYVLADVSGSVANFAAFSITLISSMSALFSRVRTFAFVENAVEVTEILTGVEHPLDAIRAINGLEGLNFYDARTDYGRSLRQFWAEVGPELGRRSTVLVFGDARGNYRPAEEETLARIARRAGALYWLNPESSSQWGSGDSLMNVYAGHCTRAVTLRTLNDLRRFVEELD